MQGAGVNRYPEASGTRAGRRMRRLRMASRGAQPMTIEEKPLTLPPGPVKTVSAAQAKASSSGSGCSYSVGRRSPETRGGDGRSEPKGTASAFGT